MPGVVIVGVTNHKLFGNYCYKLQTPGNFQPLQTPSSVTVLHFHSIREVFAPEAAATDSHSGGRESLSWTLLGFALLPSYTGTPLNIQDTASSNIHQHCDILLVSWQWPTLSHLYCIVLPLCHLHCIMLPLCHLHCIILPICHLYCTALSLCHLYCITLPFPMMSSCFLLITTATLPQST